MWSPVCWETPNIHDSAVWEVSMPIFLARLWLFCGFRSDSSIFKIGCPAPVIMDFLTMECTGYLFSFSSSLSESSICPNTQYYLTMCVTSFLDYFADFLYTITQITITFRESIQTTICPNDCWYQSVFAIKAFFNFLIRSLHFPPIILLKFLLFWEEPHWTLLNFIDSILKVLNLFLCCFSFTFPELSIFFQFVLNRWCLYGPGNTV